MDKEGAVAEPELCVYNPSGDTLTLQHSGTFSPSHLWMVLMSPYMSSVKLAGLTGDWMMCTRGSSEDLARYTRKAAHLRSGP